MLTPTSTVSPEWLPNLSRYKQVWGGQDLSSSPLVEQPEKRGAVILSVWSLEVQNGMIYRHMLFKHPQEPAKAHWVSCKRRLPTRAREVLPMRYKEEGHSGGGALQVDFPAN